jgi:hypothetical protein
MPVLTNTQEISSSIDQKITRFCVGQKLLSNRTKKVSFLTCYRRFFTRGHILRNSKKTGKMQNSFTSRRAQATAEIPVCKLGFYLNKG